MPEIDEITYCSYAETAYLAYAMSVVTGRAIPALTDGQKPVQRRILYAMRQMGLHRSPKPVKSARVVGEVLGKYHPHGDSSSYEAMVRMAQDFSLRYPLVDGQGNFGSRDGDRAAAMRYTEAKLLPIADLLLEEVEEGTVDFHENYDGTMKEPKVLPARLPFLLLNGASGIAVGLATEIPPHNLREVAAAAAHLVLHPECSDEDLLNRMPAPDYPGGGQIISSPETIRQVYQSGRGTLRVRARWTVESLARKEWQLVVYELPPGVSSAQVLSELESASNPQVKAGKKSLTSEQVSLKNTFLALLDGVRDESGKKDAVRLVFTPKSRNQSPEDIIRVLLAHTSLESNAAVNLTIIDADGRAPTLPLTDILRQWVAFRLQTVNRRSQYRLSRILERIHILEGRQKVLLDIDAVIQTIKVSDHPKEDLIGTFGLSEVQAEDILEIRLRQLARLAGIEIEKELSKLQKESKKLQGLIEKEGALRKLVAEEIQSDAMRFGDDRRTLVEADEHVREAELKGNEDPVTVIVSERGWLRTRSGHNLDLKTLTFKDGDKLFKALELKQSDTLAVLDSQGRIFNLAVSLIPGGRSEGIPLSSQVDWKTGASISDIWSVGDTHPRLLSGSNGYGFLCQPDQFITRLRSGKMILTLAENEKTMPTVVIHDEAETIIGVQTKAGLLLAFPVTEVKQLAKGKGVQLIKLRADDYVQQIGNASELQWPGDWTDYQGHRGQAGKPAGKNRKPKIAKD